MPQIQVADFITATIREHIENVILRYNGSSWVKIEAEPTEKIGAERADAIYSSV